MNKTLIVIFFVMILSTPLISTAIEFGGGTGTEEDPFLVKTPEHLYNVRFRLRDYFKQTAHIDLSDYAEGEGWDPIGEYEGSPFRGNYDGNGFTITGLVINRPDESYLGLFSYLLDATMKNIVLENVQVTGYEAVGGLAGFIYRGNITNCSVSGDISGGYRYIGGLAGFHQEGNIAFCYTRGSVSGEHWYVGGLLGWNEEADITNCSSSSKVSGSHYVGGLIGYNQSAYITANITDCYATGAVSGISAIGGLIGSNRGDMGPGEERGADITNCYATGDVSENPPGGAGNYFGGLIGFNREAKITNCYATGTISGGDWYVGGLIGVNVESDIMQCYATGKVSGTWSYVGGLAGGHNHNIGATISRSYATGAVTGHHYVGGLVGSNSDIITNSYAMGNASGDNIIGGLAGLNFNTGEIICSYSAGAVIGDEDVGGLVGLNQRGIILRSYYDRETSGHMDKGKGAPVTTEEMMQQDTFDEWDFEEIWGIIEDTTYPYLQWVMTEEEYEAKIQAYALPELHKDHHAELFLTFRNTGTQNWEQGTKVYLGAVGDQDDLAPSEYWRVGLQHDVEPAQTHTFTIPVYPEETGVYTTEWQMLKEGEFWFGEKFSKELEVTVRTGIGFSLWNLLE